MFGFKIKNMRRGPFGAALAFFDIALGDTSEDGVFTGACEVRGCVLKSGAKGHYCQFPAKQRFEKDGTTPVKKDGYNVYDNHFDLYVEGDGDERKPTSASWDFRKDVILAAVHVFESAPAGHKGRGAAPAKETAKPKPAGAKAEIDGDDAPSPVGAGLDDEDDSLPF